LLFFLFFLFFFFLLVIKEEGVITSTSLQSFSHSYKPTNHRRLELRTDGGYARVCEKFTDPRLTAVSP